MLAWLTTIAFVLCAFNAISGFGWFLAGEREPDGLGTIWGPKFWLPIGWLPMALFAAFNWPF